MSTILKSYRLPADVIDFLNKRAKGKSQAKVLEKIVREEMDQEKQWANDLKLMTQDSEYQQEQINLAEEDYED